MSTNIIGLYIFKPASGRSHLLWSVNDLSQFNYFARAQIQDMVLFHTRVVVERTEIGHKTSVNMEGDVGVCHVFNHHSGIATAAITKKDYPTAVIYRLLGECLKGFYTAHQTALTTISADVKLNFAEGEQLFRKYQDPLEVDKLGQVEKELDSVKEVMLKNLDDIMGRGEKMDELLMKTNDLSAASKQFYASAKANNQCCNIGI